MPSSMRCVTTKLGSMSPFRMWPYSGFRYLCTWHCPVRSCRPLFMNAPAGNLSISPPYTPITETIPPGRHARMASRSEWPRSVSCRVACFTRSTACSAPCPCAASMPTASITASGPRPPPARCRRPAPGPPLHAPGVDRGGGPPPAGQHLQLLDDVGVLRVVDDVRGAGLVARHLEPVVVLIHGDHSLRSEHHCARDRE